MELYIGTTLNKISLAFLLHLMTKKKVMFLQYTFSMPDSFSFRKRNIISDTSTEEKSSNLEGVNYTQIILITWIGHQEAYPDS